jgi:hypothetical protein
MFVDDEYSAAARRLLLRFAVFDDFLFNVGLKTPIFDDLFFGDLFREQVVAFQVSDGLDDRVEVLSRRDDERSDEKTKKFVSVKFSKV